MLEDLYRQIETAESQMRGAEGRLSNLRDAQASLADVVGRGEAAEGQVVVEYTSGEGLRAIDLNPRVMRLPAAELAEEIKSAVHAAVDDLRKQSMDALRSAGVLPSEGERAQIDISDVQAQVRSARESLSTSTRQAAAQIDQARGLRTRGR